MKKFLIFFISICFITLAVFFAPGAETEQKKEYRKAEITTINNQDYLIVSNSKFVEILEVNALDKLKQISEVHGMDRINDLAVIKENNKYFLVVLTGGKLIRYNITNPYSPKVDLIRNLYQTNKGKYKIGYMASMALNSTHIFTAGEKGIRRFMPDNLFVDKIYYFEKAYGVAVDDEIVAIIAKDKGIIKSIETGNTLKEVALKNSEGIKRQPIIDSEGNIYFPGDNNLTKVTANTYHISSYYNPVAPGVIHSYAVDSVGGEDVAYINGYGVTKLNDNLNKELFIKTSSWNEFGQNAWTVDLEADNTKKGMRIALLNKSSVLWYDDNFNLKDQYRYSPRQLSAITTPTELGMKLNRDVVQIGDELIVSLYGFWPNEKVSVGFYDSAKRETVTTDNFGFARVVLKTPVLESGTRSVSAIGNQSKHSYQVTVELR